MPRGRGHALVRLHGRDSTLQRSCPTTCHRHRRRCLLSRGATYPKRGRSPVRREMQGSRQRPREGSVWVGVRLGLASCNVESTDSVASTLLKEAALLGLRRLPCWSIAELRLSDEDFSVLRSWLAALDPVRAREQRETATQGLVLLTLAAEAARRFVGTGEVWPALAGLEMQPDTRHVLFAAGGAPRPDVRDSISRAATRVGLRSALHAGQPWYATVVLQFGLSPTPPIRSGVPSSSSRAAERSPASTNHIERSRCSQRTPRHGTKPRSTHVRRVGAGAWSPRAL